MGKHVEFWLTVASGIPRWLLHDLLGSRRGESVADKLHAWAVKAASAFTRLTPWRIVPNRPTVVYVYRRLPCGEEKWDRVERWW